MLSHLEEEVKMTEVSQEVQEVATARIKPRNSLLSSRKIIAKLKISTRTGLMILTRISLQIRTCPNFFKVSKLHLRKKMILKTKDMMMKMMVKIIRMTMESMERKSSKNLVHPRTSNLAISTLWELVEPKTVSFCISTAPRSQKNIVSFLHLVIDADLMKILVS